MNNARAEAASHSSKVWQLLTPDQRRGAVVLVALMLIGMLLEMLGIGLVIPALGLLTRGAASSHTAFAAVMEWLGNPTREQMAVAGMLVLAAVSLVKALFLGFLSWRQMQFVYDVQLELCRRLFSGYLRQPYTFHTERNSAQLILHITFETGAFVTRVLISVLQLLTEIFVVIGVTALLLVVEPVGTVIVAVTLGAAVWAFSAASRRRIVHWGQARQHHDGLRLQHLQQGLGGAKDVMLLGREESFIDEFQRHNVGSARAGQLQDTLATLPRLWLELLAVMGLAAIVVVKVWKGDPLDGILPTVGVFAAAAFRFMPSMNRIIGAMQNMRYSLPTIDTLHREIRLVDGTPARRSGSAMRFARELALDHVSYRYPSAAGEALRDVTLTIPRGASVGIIGGSGAGKSTLVDVLLGLLTPTFGTVRVDGSDIQANLRGWQDQIGYVPQVIFLTDDSLRRNVAFGLADDQIDDAAVHRAIRSAQLDVFVGELPDGLNTFVGERGVRLSGGQRQRIGIARALYHDPNVLVLDEATSSLDTTTERGVMDAVRALKGDKTLIIVAHRLSTIEHCDQLFRLEEGRLVDEGATAAVLANLERGDAESDAFISVAETQH